MKGLKGLEKFDTLEGRNAIIESLRAGRRVEMIMVASGNTGTTMKELIALASERGVPIKEVDRRELERLSTTRSNQGVLAFVEPYQYVSVKDILDRSRERKEDPFIVILDGVEDPQNLGSILRTCDAAGVHGVIIPQRRAAGISSTVAKASAGAVEFVPVARVTNLAREILALKEYGLWIAAADMGGEYSLYEAPLTGPIAVIIGGEGKGLARLTKEKCDFLVKIPMRGQISSLNAGVATAIMLYEVVRQRWFRMAPEV